MRFFMRAIEIYDNGLAKYPTSFDLAYNKYIHNFFAVTIVLSKTDDLQSSRSIRNHSTSQTSYPAPRAADQNPPYRFTIPSRRARARSR